MGLGDLIDAERKLGIDPPKRNTPAAAPATQHRVIPVEWHRVAVEPGDNAPARVEPMCPDCGEPMHQVGSKYPNQVYGCNNEHAAQPATDDRTADTIPDDLKERYEQVVDAISSHPNYWLCREWKRERAYIERIARLESETRIEVLEAALRLSQHALLSGEQMGGLGERYALDGALVIEACTAIRAALAAPSGETKGKV